VRGYRLTFFLAGLLIVAAVVTLVYDKQHFGLLKTNTGSWFLLIGGIVMTGYGYYEYYNKK
jgi:hypothetical protein